MSSVCFLINAVSFVAVLAALAVMRMPEFVRPAQRHNRALHALREGVSYSWHFAPIRSILLLVVPVSIVGASYVVLMPIFAERVFHGGTHILGYLMAAPGIGALAAGMYLASRKSVLGAGTRITAGAMLMGGGLLGLGMTGVLWLAMILLVLVGLGMTLQTALANTVLQTLADDDKRGRVMSLFTVAFTGTAPIGSLLAGSMAAWLGVQYTVILGGFVCIAGGLVFAQALPAIREAARPVYQRKGIIATGLDNAAALSQPPED